MPFFNATLSLLEASLSNAGAAQDTLEEGKGDQELDAGPLTWMDKMASLASMVSGSTSKRSSGGTLSRPVRL